MRIRPFLLLLAVLVFARISQAQTTVTGHVVGANTNPTANQAFIRFRLQNFAGNIPRLNGSGACAAGAVLPFVINVTPNGSGAISQVICGNDVITPQTCGAGGTSPCTFYTVEYWYQGAVQYAWNFSIIGTSFNLDIAIPLASTPPPAPPPIAGGGGSCGALAVDQILFGTSPATCAVSPQFTYSPTLNQMSLGSLNSSWPAVITSWEGNPLFGSPGNQVDFKSHIANSDSLSSSFPDGNAGLAQDCLSYDPMSLGYGEECLWIQNFTVLVNSTSVGGGSFNAANYIFVPTGVTNNVDQGSATMFSEHANNPGYTGILGSQISASCASLTDTGVTTTLQRCIHFKNDTGGGTVGTEVVEDYDDMSGISATPANNILRRVADQTLGGYDIYQVGTHTKNQLARINSPFIDGTIYVDCVIYSCSDVFAGVNAAYAALPSVGTPGWAVGKIIVSPNAAGTCYSASTPLAMTTNGKPADIDFSGACVNFTATSGIALTVDPGQGATFASNWAIRNLKLLGPCATTTCTGVTTDGIVVGATNGVNAGLLDNVQIGDYGGLHGFLTALSGNGYIYTCRSCTIMGNNVGFAPGNGEENVSFLGGSISQNLTAVNVASGVAVDANFYTTSFDDNITVAINIAASCGASTLNFFSPHFENIGLGTARYLNSACSNAFTNLHGGIYLDQNTTSTQAEMFNLAPGYISFDGGGLVSSAGETVTQFVHLDTNSRMFMAQVWKGANVSALYNTGLGTFTALEDLAGGDAILSQDSGTQGLASDSSGNLTAAGYINGASYKVGGTAGQIVFTAVLTTTAATSDNVAVTGATSSSHCTLTPTSTGADSLLTGAYISAKTTNQITVTHANANVGSTFDVLCTAN